MDKPWTWSAFGTCFLGDIVSGIPLSKHDVVTDISVDFCIENGHHALKGFTLRDCGIKHNRKVTIDHMLKYNTSNVDWHDFSSNPNCTFEIVLNYPNKNWDWQVLSEKIQFAPYIKNNPNLPWKWSFVSNNKSVCIQDIIDLSEKSWDFKKLSKFINMDDMFDHMNIPWDWEYGSYNSTLRLEHVINNPNLPWDWKTLVRCKTF